MSAASKVRESAGSLTPAETQALWKVPVGGVVGAAVRGVSA